MLGFGGERYHEYKINQPGYKAKNGYWEQRRHPGGVPHNAIHAALLHTGKVLIVAGSGNNQKNFDTGSSTPSSGTRGRTRSRGCPPPTDLFCAGHTQLPSGNGS